MIEDLKEIIHYIQFDNEANLIGVKEKINGVIRKHGECRKIHESQTENGTTAVFSWTDKEKSSD